MTEPSTKNILLIDDEEDLVWSLVGRLTRAIPDAVIEGCSVPGEAIQKLQTHKYDLIVTDLRMPEISGLDVLIEARKSNPTIPVVVMTAYPTEQVRGEALRYGSVQYLEKPFNFSQLVNAIRDGLYQPRGRGVSGAVSLETLPDLVQLFALSNITGALEMNYVGQRGAIWFDRGAIIHAHTSTRVGEDAFFEIMGWRGGEFSMERNALPPDRTIFENATGLIMEALRREDEEERDRLEQGPPPVSTSLFPTRVEGGRELGEMPRLPSPSPVPAPDLLLGSEPRRKPSEDGPLLDDLGRDGGSLRDRARQLLEPTWEPVSALLADMGTRGLAVVVDLPTGAWAALEVSGLSTIVHEPSESDDAAVDDRVHLRIAKDASELARAACALTLGEDGCMEKISGASGVAILWRNDLQLALLFGSDLQDRADVTMFRSRISAIARSSLRQEPT